MHGHPKKRKGAFAPWILKIFSFSVFVNTCAKTSFCHPYKNSCGPACLDEPVSLLRTKKGVEHHNIDAVARNDKITERRAMIAEKSFYLCPHCDAHHEKDRCTAKNELRCGCGDRGHFRAALIEITAQGREEQPLCLDSISNDHQPLRFTYLTIAKTCVKFKIDSGTDVSIIPQGHLNE